MGSSNSTSASSATNSKTHVPDKWDATHIPSLHNKVAIVTGANSGIGYVTARELARNGARVVLACRSEQRGREAEAKLRRELSELTPNANTSSSGGGVVGSVTFAKLDVGSLESVQLFVEDFKQTHDRLDMLVNNAGIMGVPYTLSTDGYESHFATNHLGHFALTAQLFGLLKASAPSRIVSISSELHRQVSGFNEDEIMLSEEKYSSLSGYNHSKLLNIFFADELDRRIAAAGVVGVKSVTAHPGIATTNLLVAPAGESGHGFFSRIRWKLMNFALPAFAQSSEMGALPMLYAATAANVQGGDYFGPGGYTATAGYPALGEPSKLAQSESAAKKLWVLSEKLAGLRFDVG